MPVVIHTRIVIEIETGCVLEDEHFSYDGPIAEAKGGGGGTSTSTSTTALPAWLQPYAEPFINTYAQKVFQWDPNTGQISGMQNFQAPQQQVAGFTPDQLSGMQAIRTMAPQAQQLAGTGAGMLGNTLAGTYLDPSTNPYLGATYEQAARQQTQQFQNAIMPGLTAAAQRAGQFGSSSMNQAMGGAMSVYNQGLTDLANQIYGGNYQAERGRQLQAQQLVPSTMASMYQPGYALSGIGAQQQALAQNQADVGYANQVSQFELPYTMLSGFGGALGQAGLGAGTSTTRATGSTGGK